MPFINPPSPISSSFLLKYPFGGFFSTGKNSAFFSLFAENAEKARLVVKTSEEKESFKFEILPHPLYPNLFFIEISSLPTCFSYSWQIERNNSWGPLFADPFANYLAGSHTWKKTACFDAAYVDLTQMWPSYEITKGPSRLPNELVIYECHTRAATMRCFKIEKEKRGTFEGLLTLVDHVAELGCNAIELMPIWEFNEKLAPFCDPATSEPLVNFWGYMPMHFGVLFRGYSIDGQSITSEKEFANFVDYAHKKNLSVIIDVVLNHVDNSSYQALVQIAPESAFHHKADYSGCGNALNLQNPFVAALALHQLRSLAMRFSIDGLRFDLAAALARTDNGSIDLEEGFMKRLHEDPILGCLLLLAEPWDAQGGYLLGQMALKGTIEWNDHYRDDVRRFLQFSEGKNLCASRLCGSQDIYPTCQVGRSLNFITCHDGMSLCDLVSYNEKHNENNGEEGRDGHCNNLSFNHGVEGETSDPKIQQLRLQQMKNFALALAISRGPIMLLSGDEIGHTRKGNNNPWCQDNEINALNWQIIESNPPLLQYWKKLLQWRSQKGIFQSTHYYSNEDINWYKSDGTREDWSNSPYLLFEIKTEAESIFVAFNTSMKPLPVFLPKNSWQLLFSSAEVSFKPSSPVLLPARSSMLLEAKKQVSSTQNLKNG